MGLFGPEETKGVEECQGTHAEGFENTGGGKHQRRRMSGWKYH